MSNGLNKQSLRATTRSALQRIESLEGEVPRIIQAVNQTLGQVDQRITNLAEILEAVVELTDATQVDTKLKEIRDRKALDAADRAKANLETAITKGEAVRTDEVKDKSLIVGREFDKEGNEVFPGRVQLFFGGVKPDYQEKLKGQVAGFKFETDNGTFEVLEVYDIVEKAEEAPPLADGVPAETVMDSAPTAEA